MGDYDKIPKMSPVDANEKKKEGKPTKSLLRQWWFWVLWFVGIGILRFIMMFVFAVVKA